MNDKSIDIGDIVIRLCDGAEGVVTRLGADKNAPWWQLVGSQPKSSFDSNKFLVKWLPKGISRWISFSSEGFVWKRQN